MIPNTTNKPDTTRTSPTVRTSHGFSLLAMLMDKPRITMSPMDKSRILASEFIPLKSHLNNPGKTYGYRIRIYTSERRNQKILLDTTIYHCQLRYWIKFVNWFNITLLSAIPDDFYIDRNFIVGIKQIISYAEDALPGWKGWQFWVGHESWKFWLGFPDWMSWEFKRFQMFCKRFVDYIKSRPWKQKEKAEE